MLIKTDDVTSKFEISLKEMTEDDIQEVTDVVKLCYSDTDDIYELLNYYDFKKDLNMPGCRWWYKIMQGDVCVGAVNLAYTGKDSMTIRNIAYTESDNNIYIFELLKQAHPNVSCWLMFDAGEEINEYCYPDREMKKAQFREDNGFRFLTDANRRKQYEYLTKPFEQIYNGSKYQFAQGLDNNGDLSDISWLRCAMGNADWYDNYMGNWRITDSFFGDALLYDNFMGKNKYYKNDMGHSDFSYNDMKDSLFKNNDLRNSKFENCDISGMTIDGIDVEKALNFYKEKKNSNL